MDDKNRPMAERYGPWRDDKHGDWRVEPGPREPRLEMAHTDGTFHACGVCAGIDEEVLVRELLRLRAKLDAAPRELEAWEDREGACCPEDIGFPEYIAFLNQQIGELSQGALQALKELQTKLDAVEAVVSDLRARIAEGVVDLHPDPIQAPEGQP